MNRIPRGVAFVSSGSFASLEDDTFGVGRNPNHHAKGVYIIRPSDGISSMHSIVYHPCNAWYIIKALPCIPLRTHRLPSLPCVKEGGAVGDGRLVLRAEQSYSASEAFAQLFSMLEERTRASIEEREA